MCLAGAVVASWSLTQEVVEWQGFKPFYCDQTFVSLNSGNSLKHLGKTPLHFNVESWLNSYTLAGYVNLYPCKCLEPGNGLHLCVILSIWSVLDSTMFLLQGLVIGFGEGFVWWKGVGWKGVCLLVGSATSAYWGDVFTTGDGEGGMMKGSW